MLEFIKHLLKNCKKVKLQLLLLDTLNGGDPRFTVEPGISGSGADQTVRVLKPLDVGLDTALVVMTDRRTYHFRLRSTRNESMPYAAFMYPECCCQVGFDPECRS